MNVTELPSHNLNTPEELNTLRENLMTEFTSAIGVKEPKTLFQDMYFKGFNEDPRARNTKFHCRNLHMPYLIPYYLATVLNAEKYQDIREQLISMFRIEALNNPLPGRTVTLDDVLSVEDALNRHAHMLIYTTQSQSQNPTEENQPDIAA